MARIRTIKPDFFRHEELQDLEAANPGAYVMLVFAGLWGHCDKEGRFPWKPRTLKLDILPFLDFNLSASLVLLREAGMIRQYEIDGNLYGEVPTFNEHQRISGKEAQEPAKHPEPKGYFTDASQGKNGEATGKHLGSQEGKGKEGKGREGKGVQEGKGKEGGADAPDDEGYAFEGNVVRLNRPDYERWKKAYSAIPDFEAALVKADDYYREHPMDDGKWFFRISKWLEKENTKALTDIPDSLKRENTPDFEAMV